MGIELKVKFSRIKESSDEYKAVVRHKDSFDDAIVMNVIDDSSELTELITSIFGEYRDRMYKDFTAIFERDRNKFYGGEITSHIHIRGETNNFLKNLYGFRAEEIFKKLIGID